MSYLYNAGCQLNFQLFGEGNRHLVEDFFKQTFPDWESSGLPNKIPRMIELKAPDHRLLLPFEFLPLFNTSGNLPEIKDLDSLRKAAARFLGFSTIISRIFYSQSKPSTVLTDTSFNNSNGLGVRFFCHAGLAGAIKEQEFFETTPGIRYLGAWPKAPLSNKAFIDSLSSMLWHGYDASVIGVAAPDHIQHFSCHCDTEQNSSVDYSLTLAVKKKSIFGGVDENKIKLGELQQKFGTEKKRSQAITYPLIFLNACGSSKMLPQAVNSFPGLFLEINNRGVIGTETKIPDHFACEFSKFVYLKLLNSQTLGDAIYSSRWHFLLTYKNPLGLLYIIYANPDLRVAVPLEISKMNNSDLNSKQTATLQ
jgi:hypothetical protein